MQQRLNAKTPRSKDAKSKSEIGLFKIIHRLVNRIVMLRIHFASLRLSAFALKSSTLTARMRFSMGQIFK